MDSVLGVDERVVSAPGDLRARRRNGTVAAAVGRDTRSADGRVDPGHIDRESQFFGLSRAGRASATGGWSAVTALLRAPTAERGGRRNAECLIEIEEGDT